jgi:hypothetical protein
MSLSPKPWVLLARRAAWVALTAVGSWGGYLGVVRILGVDAFSSLRAREITGFDADTGIRMTDVELRQYKDGKLVTKTDAKDLTVSRDRNEINLTHLNNGVRQGPKGTTKFASERGKWNSLSHRLELGGKTRLAGKDFDLTTDLVVMDERERTIVMPNAIAGKIKGGTGHAASLTYNTATEAFNMGPAKWRGPLNGIQDVAGQTDPRTKWDVQAAKTVSDGSKTNTEHYTDAQATDGEILVKAPKIDRNTKTDVLTATGRVFYYSAKANFVADKIVVFRKEKRALITGNVVMLVKPKQKVPEGTVIPPKEEEIPPFRPIAPEQATANRPSADYGPTKEEKDLDAKLRDGQTVREYPSVITASTIEYFYAKGSRRAEISGEPQARQEFSGNRWRHVWAKTGHYDGEKETLLLESTPGKRDLLFKTSLGDHLTALNFLISTKEDDDSYSGEGITGSVYQDDDDDPRDKKKKDPSAPKTGGGTSGGGGT